MISLITPIYSSRPRLVEMLERLFLDGVARNCPGDTELVLIDDGSPLRSETERLVAGIARTRKVHYIANPVRLGYVKSCNLGLRRATGQILLQANSDIRFTRGSVDSLLRALSSAPDVGLVGPVVNNACDQRPQQVDGFAPLSAYSDAEMERIERFSSAVRRQLAGVWEVDWLIGCCTMMRREVLDKVGYLDERFGLGYYEEVDYCLRARAAGYRLLVDRGTFLFHGGTAPPIPGLKNWSSQSMRTRPFRAFYEVLRNTFYVSWKHGLRTTGRGNERHNVMRNAPIAAD